MSEERIAQIERGLEEVRERFNSLTANTRIPYEVDRAFRERFSDIIGLTVSSKSINSEDVTVVTSVNFGAQTTGTGVVLDDPDAWLQVTLAGIPYYIPAYTS